MLVRRIILFIILLNTLCSYGQEKNKTTYNIKKTNNTYETIFGYPNMNLYDSVYSVNLYVGKDTSAWDFLKPFTFLETIEIPNFPKKSLIIPSIVCKFKHLKGIYQHSKKTTLPPCFSTISTLEELSFSWSHYNKIPSNIYNLLNLKTLRIGKYTGKVLTPEINNLTNLEELEINNLSKIKEIPLIIYDLINLKILSIYTKKSISLNIQIKNLKKLETLSLNIDLMDKNTIEILSQMKSLKNLTVYKLSNYDSNILQLSFLETLTINKNKLNEEKQKELKKMLPNTQIKFF